VPQTAADVNAEKKELLTASYHLIRQKSKFSV